MAKLQVTMDDVARVIELWTGIPAEKVSEDVAKKMANLERELKARIIGQDERSMRWSRLSAGPKSS